MEYLESETLEARILRNPVKVDDALKIAIEIADPFDTSHRAGIVHRDLKPAKIARTREGNVEVLEFGLAKATDIGTLANRCDSLGSARVEEL